MTIEWLEIDEEIVLTGAEEALEEYLEDQKEAQA